MGVRLADIFAAALPYIQTRKLATVVVDAFNAIMSCRTERAGGHVARCDNGHVVGVYYNACRHRSCPRCSWYRVQKWLERQVRTLVGCAHHHAIFTVPHDLNDLWLCNYAVMGDALFSSARDALFDLLADKRYLGARPGVIMSLHTWGQQLPLHPHVHCLVTAGGVDADGQWIPSPRRILAPAEPLKRLFRGKFLYQVRGLLRRGKLRLPDGWTAADVEAICDRMETRRWNVHLLERYDDPSGVLNYLGRYLHGGPIGESRLVAFDGETVTFRYKDYRDQGPNGPRQKDLRLGRDEFVRRVLMHVAPKGFHLVRGYGLYRRGGSTEALRREVCRALPPGPELQSALVTRIERVDPPTVPTECPTCKAPVTIVACPRAGPDRAAAA